jgi:hypothetical protein
MDVTAVLAAAAPTTCVSLCAHWAIVRLIKAVRSRVRMDEVHYKNGTFKVVLRFNKKR